jgi:predicted RNA-binding Zn-ribbon protein involved in translation (DUF1610 family)
MKLKDKTDDAEIAVCDECESEFYQASSEMSSLCPECANAFYGYENCKHEFNNGRCLKCYWNGSISTYIKNLKLAKL